MIFVKNLQNYTKEESIFHVLNEIFIETGITLSNIVSVAIDGAPTILAVYREFLAYLKKAMPTIFAVQRVIYHQF